MGCRKNSPGKPCCETEPCPSECDVFFDEPYHDITFTFNGIANTVRIYKGVSFPCNYIGSICYVEDSTVETYVCVDELILPSSIAAVTCPTCDSTIVEYTEYPFSYTTFESGRPEYSYLQTRERRSYKLFQWRKRRYTVSVSLRQLSGTAMRLQVSITTEERIRYTYSDCNKYSHRKITVPSCPDRTCTFADGVLTCDVDWTTPPEPTIGPWISDGEVSEPPDPQDPFGEGCPAATAWPFSDYVLDRAFPYVCPDTTTFDTVTIRSFVCAGNWGTTDSTFNQRIGERCCEGAEASSSADSYLVQSVDYFSLPLECNDLCGATPVYRDTPRPEDGLPSGDLAGGSVEDPNIILPDVTAGCESTLTKTRNFIGKPATFNATIC